MRSHLPVPLVTSRRQLLVISGAMTLGALAGCTTSPSPSQQSPSGTADPDGAVRATVASSQTALAAAFAATVRAFPTLAKSLAVGDRHVSYAAAVTATATATATALPTASATDLPLPVVSPAAPVVPTTAVRAVAALAKAEQLAAGQCLTQIMVTVDPELTRIITLIGAGCASAGSVLAGPNRA
ncbi:MAG: hypothetical protein ABI468_11810 [Candidatus Nanopelagicales bacterium]